MCFVTKLIFTNRRYWTLAYDNLGNDLVMIVPRPSTRISVSDSLWLLVEGLLTPLTYHSLHDCASGEVYRLTETGPGEEVIEVMSPPGLSSCIVIVIESEPVLAGLRFCDPS
ncbi:hypothetical protein EVAR_79109_1 [Eumeta japonica]|uniref:Uncharacterized protein n=1 Tax=Eumeta variegata TaxID=151549 RepID=A0A4C1X1D8_EUMVA|nr:hypothetical protein EVAR_79109_1 [Eumeta japonica]